MVGLKRLMLADCPRQVMEVLAHEHLVVEVVHYWVWVVPPQPSLLCPSPMCWRPRDSGMCEISFAHKCKWKRKLLGS